MCVFVHKHTHFQNKSYLEEVQAKAKRKGEARLPLHAPLLASGATAQQTRLLPPAFSLADFSVWKALCSLSRGGSPVMEGIQGRDPIIKMQILSQHSVEIYLHKFYF